MIYKIKVKKEKSAAFYQMLQSLRDLDVIESVELVDDSEEGSLLLGEETLWIKEKGKDHRTLEIMEKYRDLVDLD